MPKAPPLIWLPEAVEDLARLRDFLHPNNPAAARRAAKRILDGAKSLRRNPAVGRPVDAPEGFRDLVLSFGAGAYVLRYRLAEDVIVVVRVWHSRETR